MWFHALPFRGGVQIVAASVTITALSFTSAAHTEVAKLKPVLPISASVPEPLEWPERAPDFHGRIEITYIPIMCGRAPCPPGSYRLKTPDGESIRAAVVVLRRSGSTEAEPVVFKGKYLGKDQPVKARADLWVSPDGGPAFVTIHKIHSGEVRW